MDGVVGLWRGQTTNFRVVNFRMRKFRTGVEGFKRNINGVREVVGSRTLVRREKISEYRVG